MKIGMIGIVNNLSTRMSSHNAGWTYVSRSALETYFNNKVEILDNSNNYENYDILVINEGVNYRQDVFNFFGGVQESQIDSLIKFSNFKGKIYCVNIPIDYNILTTKRKELKHLDIVFEKPDVINLNQVSNKLVLGDSHSLSVYKQGYGISRNDGKTLHGFLKLGLKNFINESINDLIFYSGNIDIRFHLHQFGKSGIDKLILELERQLIDLNIKSISLVKLIPIEEESRKLPGTGLYKGQPFYGSKELRSELVNYFNEKLNDICIKNNWNILSWKFNYENLSFDFMEAKQSVHLRPSSYMFINQFIYGND
ncbi:hypothetical protein UFOVP520_20 [uncultured Caudovirales phage]|jgi:hypothetical protein|uniref:Uncharacterized protein n=1 Tax=uncultured Caudovirales phage TaxID=2100421 RepID=A0A6J5MQ87_9CAUD|nr:hypothetical protein UFOVP520_20 [uncultured Caudovirales phage]